MKKLFFIILFVSNSIFLKSQEYFNFRFDFDQTGWWDDATTLYKASDGYVFAGGSVYYQNYLRLGFYKVDFEGNFLFSKSYFDSINLFPGSPGSIINLSADTILAVGTKQFPATPWDHSSGVLYFLNPNFDTLFTKVFGENLLPHDTAVSFRQCKIDHDTNIIIAGTKWPYSSLQKLLLMKIDRKGNKLWEKSYFDGQQNMGLSVICTSDGGYAIGGFAYQILPPPNNSGDPVVLKTDSAGNRQWYLNFGGPFIDSRGMLCKTADGNMVLGTAYCDSMTGGNPHMTGHPYRRINLIKIDNAGNMIWDKKYGTSEEETTLLNIRENEDGTLISTGYTMQFFTYTFRSVGWMLKTDANGETIWYRQYNIGEGENTWHYLYDALETPDKGYLACGVVYAVPPDTGSQDGWAIKVDSLGCENPNMCWVGIKPDPYLPPGSALKIFPNPAGKDIMIKMQGLLQRKRIKIRLYDLFGREVESIELLPGQIECRLDVSALPGGLYMAVVESGDQILAKEKIVKYPQ
jgi:hypothetical protein